MRVKKNICISIRLLLLYFDRYVDSSHCRGDVAHDIGPGFIAVSRDRRPLHGRLSTPKTVSSYNYNINCKRIFVYFYKMYIFISEPRE